MNKTRILIVEDDNLTAMILKTILIKLGRDVVDIAAEGPKAIDDCKLLKPDLVLMDIGLSGGMDGIEAARIIKERYDIPVVFVTSSSDDDTLQRAKITDPSGYVVKPIIERDLRTTIEMALYKHKLERRLKETAGWLKIVLKSIADAVLSTDSSGSVNFMNPVAERMIGVSAQLASGRQFEEIFRIVDQEGIQSKNFQAAELISSLQPVESSGDTLLHTLDGRFIPIEFTVSPIVDDSGFTGGVVAVFRDITQRKEIEAGMKNALIKERELSELKSRFISMVSHEFRTPMTSIQASAEFLEKYFDNITTDKKIKNIQRIQGNIQHMTQLLNDILFIGKSDANKLAVVSEPTDLRELCENLAEQFMSIGLVRQYPELVTEFKIAAGSVLLDKKLVTQILENLLSNAVKYSPPLSRVDFKVECAGKIASFTVADKGIGIPEADIKHLWEPFHRASNTGSVPGTGLGLSIVKRAVDLLGGTISAESRENEGTIFNVILPVNCATEK